MCVYPRNPVVTCKMYVLQRNFAFAFKILRLCEANCGNAKIFARFSGKCYILQVNTKFRDWMQIFFWLCKMYCFSFKIITKKKLISKFTKHWHTNHIQNMKSIYRYIGTNMPPSGVNKVHKYIFRKITSPWQLVYLIFWVYIDFHLKCESHIFYCITVIISLFQ